jgi:hypothetical protein
MEWKAVYYNGLETNIEVTKCGKVKRVKKDWYGFSKYSQNQIYGEVDIDNLKVIRGYKSVTVQIKGLNRKSFEIHQLVAAAFLNYKWNGKAFVVDHIDNNKLNNNLDNLQIVSFRENTSKDKWRTKKSGLPLGVSWCKSRNKYKAAIYFNSVHYNLGRYNTIEEAEKAYQNKLKSLSI